MISLYALCVLAVAFSVNGQQHYYDPGPCDTPAVTFTWDQFPHTLPQKTKWYGLYTNYELAKHPATAWKCYELEGEAEEGGIWRATVSHTEGDSHITYETKYTPHPNKPGTYKSYKKTADGEWEPFGWEYTAIAFEDKYVIEYACKELEDKHEDYFTVYGLDKDIPEEIATKLKKHAEDNGDETDFVAYSQENC